MAIPARPSQRYRGNGGYKECESGTDQESSALGTPSANTSATVDQARNSQGGLSKLP